MKSQVLLTVWCNISGGAGGEIWHWSVSGVKGLIDNIPVGQIAEVCCISESQIVLVAQNQRSHPAFFVGEAFEHPRDDAGSKFVG